jgi:hypothetical protein
MAKQRSTFGKLQRAADKQAKARAKQERRAARAEAVDEEPEDTGPVMDEAIVLEALAELQQSFADGKIGMEEFETRRDQLAAALQIN